MSAQGLIGACCFCDRRCACVLVLLRHVLCVLCCASVGSGEVKRGPACKDEHVRELEHALIELAHLKVHSVGTQPWLAVVVVVVVLLPLLLLLLLLCLRTRTLLLLLLLPKDCVPATPGRPPNAT